MKIIPCTRCPECGLVNWFTVTQCECGTDLRRCKVVRMDVSRLTQEEYGLLDGDLTAYAQRCSKCGGIAYTTSPRQRRQHCPNCGSDAIGSFRPIYFLDLPEA